jgi:hypothetical protein
MARRYFHCSHCGVFLQVSGAPAELDRLDPIMSQLARKCVYDCSGSMLVEVAPTNTHLHLTVAQLVSALAGLGLPSEIDASVETVSALLRTYTIKDFQLLPSRANPSRAILDWIMLDNGATIHLVCGAEGPTVYKITRGSHERDANTDPLLPPHPEDRLVQCSADQLAGPTGPIGSRPRATGQIAGATASGSSAAPNAHGWFQEEPRR